MATFQDLIDLNQEMTEAEKSQNAGFYKQLLAEDFTFRRANGHFTGKAGYLEGLTGTTYSTLEAWDFQPNLITKDIALVECRVTAEGRRPDTTAFQGTFTNVRFFRRNGASWNLYAWHNVQTGVQQARDARFTGHVIVQTLQEEPDNNVYQVFFHPAARTHWHIHTGFQDLFVVSGNSVVVQRTHEGDKRTIIRNREKIRIPPGMLHWHGATPETFMIHVTNNLQNRLLYTYWFQEVANEEYLYTRDNRRNRRSELTI